MSYHVRLIIADGSGFDFSRYLENPSLNLSLVRGEVLIAPPSLQGKGAGGLGLALTFPHDVKSQIVDRFAL